MKKLADIIKMCWQQDLENRPTARELVARISALVDESQDHLIEPIAEEGYKDQESNEDYTFPRGNVYQATWHGHQVD